ncbi:MAG: PIN domain-containing protein [Bacteroidia bacterium]|nr:PIN domain-containing protein [Bacteroidia bacterium]
MVIVDTNIFIAAIRGNEMALSMLRKYKLSIYISIVSIIELSVGATDKNKKKVVAAITEDHTIIPLSKSIGERALKLVDTYSSPARRLFLPDALIAATCLENNAALLTFNSKDFKFIKGLQFAK